MLNRNTFFKSSVFFTNVLFPGIGGMEMHQFEIMKKIKYIFTRDGGFSLYRKHHLEINTESFVEIVRVLHELIEQEHIQFFIFNNLSWINYIKELKDTFPFVKIIIRSGGNDIFRAPIDDDNISLPDRQRIVRDIINSYVDVLIINSDFSYLRNLKLGIYPEKMKKVRGGVSNRIKWYSLFSWYMTLFIRTRYRIGEKIILTYAGRFQDFKGIFDFVNFIPNEVVQKIHVFLAGKGPLLNKVCTLLGENGISYNYLGELENSQVLKYISVSDYLINPSKNVKRFFGNDFYIHTETMGRSMMEALSLNIPLIASDVGGIPELFLESENYGYDFKSYEDVPTILISLSKQKKKIISPDYSWNNVFSFYNSLLISPNKNMLVVDLDGTLITSSSDVIKIKKILAKYINEFIFIINTARPLNEDSIYLYKYLNADYLICSNGLDIYSDNQSFRWNQNDFLRANVISEIDSYLPKIKERFQSYSIKKTHEHIIQIKNLNGFTEIDLDNLKELLQNSNLDFLYNKDHIKVFSHYISKLAALNYIKKNINYNKTYAAGNGLNDIQFVESADYGWISEDLLPFITKKNVRTFYKEEVGVKLMSKILAKMFSPAKL